MQQNSVARNIIFTLVFALILISLAVVAQRAQLLTQAVTDPHNGRYAKQLVLTLMHILPAAVFLALCPLQFIAAIRSKFPRFHRWSGRLCVLTGIIIGISSYGLVITIGFAGPFEVANVFIFATLFLVCLGFAVHRIHNGQIAAHREWMIRTFAIGLASGGARLVYLIITQIWQLEFAQAFLLALWIAFPLLCVCSELWIRYTRPVQKISSHSAVVEVGAGYRV